MEINKIYCEPCEATLSRMPDNSIDAVVTDPPYGLSFMGKKWDYDVPSVEIWQECLRVLKPGGYLLAFAGTRTQHRMAVRIEDAGFEIRDMIAWVYGSGFPKSLDVGKAVDKLQGNEREFVGTKDLKRGSSIADQTTDNSVTGWNKPDYPSIVDITLGTSDWEGWGTALKPAFEPVTVARKPIEGTVAENVLKWGTGGINIDGCRLEVAGRKTGTKNPEAQKGSGNCYQGSDGKKQMEYDTQNKGRFPANFIHDGSDEVLSLFPVTKSGKAIIGTGKGYAENASGIASTGIIASCFADTGSAARFFYCAKASKSERDQGCGDVFNLFEQSEGLETKNASELTGRKDGSKGLSGSEVHGNSTNPYANGGSVMPRSNHHPTVKPIALMEYLIKLVSREGALIYDPFAGSGSTGIAAAKLKRNFILSELSPEYAEIAEKRLQPYLHNLFTIEDDTVTKW